jgi:hypothetical protein
MAAERSRWSRGAALAGITVLAAGAAVAVPALAGGEHREQARRPTLASLAKQVASLRSQDATLRRRISALSKRASVAGPRGVAGPVGPVGASGAAGAPGAPGSADAYTRAESDARFVRGPTVEALFRVEVAPSGSAVLADLGALGRLQGTCGPLSSPPETILQPPVPQSGAIDVVADVGVVNAMTGNPSLVLQTIDPAAPAPVDLPGTGQAYHALIHVAQGVGPGARIAALDVTGFKIAAGAFPCRYTVRLTTTGAA